MRRPVLLGVAWVAAAAVAVGLGFLAVSFVSASPTATLVTAAAPLTTSPTSSAPAAVTTARQGTPGGTVVAHCTAGRAEVAGAPAAGWWTDDSTESGAVEFTDGTQKVEVRATCATGTPSFVVEGPKAESDNPAVVSQSPATDDKGGRHGGGGRDGGGHGSDG
jgi:hypothetical protein